MASLWKKGAGIGLGAGLLGATVLALRLRARPTPHPSLPDIISPSVFSRRVQRTTRGQIVYHVSGEGEPLIFLHDFFPGAASYEWSKIYPSFSKTHRVLAPDWIGFGESERPDRLLRAEDYAQCLREFVRATCGGRRPVLVGSGLGAALACLAAAQHPELVARLILFHPIGTAEWAKPWVPRSLNAATWSRRGRQWLYNTRFAPPERLKKWLSSRRSPGASLDLTEAVSVFSSFARQYGAAWAVLRILSGRFNVPPLPRLGGVCVPVTIWLPEFDAEKLPEAAAHAETRVDRLENCGPLAPLDQAENLTTRLQTELFQPMRMVRN